MKSILDENVPYILILVFLNQVNMLGLSEHLKVISWRSKVI